MSIVDFTEAEKLFANTQDRFIDSFQKFKKNGRGTTSSKFDLCQCETENFLKYSFDKNGTYRNYILIGGLISEALSGIQSLRIYNYSYASSPFNRRFRFPRVRGHADSSIFSSTWVMTCGWKKFDTNFEDLIGQIKITLPIVISWLKEYGGIENERIDFLLGKKLIMLFEAESYCTLEQAERIDKTINALVREYC